MMKFRKSLFFGIAAAVSILAVSCASNGGNPIEPTPGGGDTTGNGAGFLKTDYEPLNKWLDERFEVKYVDMTPQSVFDQQPLKDIFYETSNLPTKAPALNFEAADISRRELLRKIATHWKLKMSLVEGADGKPTAVRVTG